MGESSLLVCMNNTTVPTAAESMMPTTNQRREKRMGPIRASLKVQPSRRL